MNMEFRYYFLVSFLLTAKIVIGQKEDLQAEYELHYWPLPQNFSST